MIIRINNIELNKNELLHLIDNGKIIQAIKLVKTKTRLGLKECKDIVDNLSDNRNFYDGKDYVSETKNESITQNPKRSKTSRGSHIIKTDSSKTKNYIILLLLVCIVVLIYMYLVK